MFQFQDGTLVEEGYVEITGIKYPIVMPKYTGDTPLSSENLMKMQIELLKTVFPVGSTYITQDNVNPSITLNFGTWERVKGRVIIGLDEDDSNLNQFRKEGGEKTHILTIEELTNHSHLQYAVANPDTGGPGTRGTFNQQEGTGMSLYSTNTNTGDIGSNRAFNIMQPYIVAGYMWIRIQ